MDDIKGCAKSKNISLRSNIHRGRLSIDGLHSKSLPCGRKYYQTITE